MPRLRGWIYSRRARLLRRRMRDERTVAAGQRGEGPLEFLTGFTSHCHNPQYGYGAISMLSQ